MHYVTPRALIALSLLTGCATTPPALQPQINLQRPSECLSPCPQLPTPNDGGEIAVTRRVNGGLTGFDDRLKLYRAALRYLGGK